jgi:hypothetical protein
MANGSAQAQQFKIANLVSNSSATDLSQAGMQQTAQQPLRPTLQ